MPSFKPNCKKDQTIPKPVFLFIDSLKWLLVHHIIIGVFEMLHGTSIEQSGTGNNPSFEATWDAYEFKPNQLVANVIITKIETLKKIHLSDDQT